MIHNVQKGTNVVSVRICRGYRGVGGERNGFEMHQGTMKGTNGGSISGPLWGRDEIFQWVNYNGIGFGVSRTRVLLS